MGETVINIQGLEKYYGKHLAVSNLTFVRSERRGGFWFLGSQWSWQINGYSLPFGSYQEKQGRHHPLCWEI